MSLNKAIARFNDGCAHFTYALNALSRTDIPEYERQLISAGGDTIGALEWSIKIYLRQSRRADLTPEDYASLQNPDFRMLVQLLGRYAEPQLSNAQLAAFEDYRRSLRNPGEHEAFVPSAEKLGNAIQDIRQFLLEYLHVDGSRLKRIPNLPRDESLENLRRDYFKMLAARFEFLDLGGVSPRVGNTVIRIRMENVFIPLSGLEDVTLLETFGEDLSRGDEERQNNLAQAADVPWDTYEWQANLINEAHKLKTPSRSFSIEQLLAQPRLVILGDPGSGKSTLGRFIAYSIATNTHAALGPGVAGRIPIIIRASEFGTLLSDESNLSLYSYITERMHPKYGPLFIEAMKNTSALIIIDGLDEIPNSALRTQSTRRIEEFVSEFTETQFIVTSRVVGYRQHQLSGDFKEVRLAPFAPGDILDFLIKWHTAVDHGSGLSEGEQDATRRAQALWEAIRNSPGTRRLATNPLLLTIIALASWRGTKLPNRRVELYQIATETLLENWPLRQRGQELRAHELLSILEPIAFEMLERGSTNAISDFDLRPVVETKVCEIQGVDKVEARSLSREILERIADHTGFFIERGFDQEGRSIYGFLHLTFAEYLAGRHLAEQWSLSPTVLSTYAHDARWREVVLLMAGHVGTWAVAQVTKLVTDTLDLDSPFEQQIHRDLLLAASMLADNARVSREIQDRVVNELLKLLLANGGLEEITKYAQSLLRAISEVSPLGTPLDRLNFSSSEGPEVQLRKAKLSLSVAFDAETASEVIATLMKNPSIPASMRREAVDSLIGFGGADKAAGAVAVFIDGPSSAYSASRSTIERLKRIRSISSSIDECLDGMLDGICVIDANDLRQFGVDSIADKLISSDYSSPWLLSFAVSFSDIGVDVCRELINRGMNTNENFEKRLSALRSVSHLLRDRISDSGDLVDLLSVLREAALSTQPVDFRIEAASIYVLLLGVEDDTSRSNLIDFSRQLFPNIASLKPQSIRSLLGSYIPPQYRVTSMEHQTNVIRESGLESLLRRWLSEGTIEIKKDCAHALVNAGVYTEADLKLVLDASENAASDEDPYEHLDLLWTLLSTSQSDATAAVAAESLCSFVASWQSSTAPKDELDKLDDYLSFFGEYSSHRLGPHASEALIDGVVGLLDSPDSTVRRRGAKLWGKVRRVNANPLPLLEKLNDDPQAAAAIWLGLPFDALNDPGLLELGIEALSSDENELSSAAASALASVREESCRLMVVNRVSEIIASDPDNAPAITVLWGLFGPARPKMFGTSPF